MREMLVPMPWTGPVNAITDPTMQWLKALPVKSYCALWQSWPSQKNYHLPSGYEVYVVSFHLEAVDWHWLQAQRLRLQCPIIVLSDSNFYDNQPLCFTWYYWPQQLGLMQQWFGRQHAKDITHKFSAVCNRITQSKLLIFTKLAETSAANSLLILNDELGHDARILTQDAELDHLMKIFWNKYHGHIIRIDDFVNKTDNVQSITANPWTPIYQHCAIHFTNESFHYSKTTDQAGTMIWPGPFITEKTLKCLVGGTAFVAVGQFDTYRTLSNLGCRFDYGFDISWDNDSGNISRLKAIVNLIDQLDTFDCQQLYAMTRSSTEHNQDLIWSGQFAKNCELVNQTTQTEILQMF